MFIETLEFTIPIDLCDLFTTLKKGPRSNLEFPASVNSYGTTQDASIQVVLKSNKVTFKVDGVSSDASMISKSECKTLKLSIFDVDRSLMPLDDGYSDISTVQTSTPVSNSSKRTRDYSAPVSPPPPHKSRRSSFSDSSRNNNTSIRNNQSSSQSRIPSDSVNIKQEPEDPDLIEIEPDDIEPKKEVPYMQIDYSSSEPRTHHTSQSALDRLSHHQSSYSQSPASSSSSFHQNVPHVQDYAEPGTSHGQHGDQSADDYLVFQDDDGGGDENEADYSNDGYIRGESVNVDGLELAFQDQLVNGEEHMNITRLPNGKKRDCAECSNRPVRRVRTSFMCSACNVGLCLGLCWKHYHMKKGFQVPEVPNPCGNFAVKGTNNTCYLP